MEPYYIPLITFGGAVAILLWKILEWRRESARHNKSLIDELTQNIGGLQANIEMRRSAVEQQQRDERVRLVSELQAVDNSAYVEYTEQETAELRQVFTYNPRLDRLAVMRLVRRLYPDRRLFRVESDIRTRQYILYMRRGDNVTAHAVPYETLEDLRSLEPLPFSLRSGLVQPQPQPAKETEPTPEPPKPLPVRTGRLWRAALPKPTVNAEASKETSPVPRRRSKIARR